jgi:hypothetical protein
MAEPTEVNPQITDLISTTRPQETEPERPDDRAEETPEAEPGSDR